MLTLPEVLLGKKNKNSSHKTSGLIYSNIGDILIHNFTVMRHIYINAQEFLKMKMYLFLDCFVNLKCTGPFDFL